MLYFLRIIIKTKRKIRKEYDLNTMRDYSEEYKNM